MRRTKVFHGSGRRRGPVWISRLVVGAFLLIIAMRWFSQDSDKSTAPTSPGQTVPARQAAQEMSQHDRQEVLALLKRPEGVAPRDGVAVAILVDTSGSMNESVAGRGGRRVKKLDAARAAVSELIRNLEATVAKGSKRTVLLSLYEFSRHRGSDDVVRQLLPPAPPDAEAAAKVVGQMRADGGTPIGQAILTAKRDLDATGLDGQHILVITDGQNTLGHEPAAILSLFYEPELGIHPIAVYFVAFDIAAEAFAASRDAGAVVLSASDDAQLRTTLDTIMTDRILIEGSPPEPP